MNFENSRGYLLKLIFNCYERNKHFAWISWAQEELIKSGAYMSTDNRQFGNRVKFYFEDIAAEEKVEEAIEDDLDLDNSPVLSRQAQPENLNADFESFVTSNKWVQK